ncbi:MAG: biotin/lipoyl-binding protein, partial [Magnetococcales bacterium]|nr:biotin/lipoyl-binding protein [Magnetococcales bacterium]
MTSVTPASDRTVNHLAKSVLLAESGSPLIVRAVIQLGLASLLFFFIWAAFMTLDEVARASGETVPKSHVQKIQHFGGGTVAAILVREGQTVANQELLLRLDPMLSQSQVDQTIANRNALMARKTRLQALSDGKEPDFGELREHPVGQNEQRLWWQDANAQKLAGMT